MQPQARSTGAKRASSAFMRAIERGMSSVHFQMRRRGLAQLDTRAHERLAAAQVAVAAAARDRAADRAGRERRARSRWFAASRSTPPTSSSRRHAMDRRRFLKVAASTSLGRSRRPFPELRDERCLGASPCRADYRKLLVLIELKGGNDGLNTARAVRRPDLLRAAAEARHLARQRRAAHRPRGPASRARAAAAVVGSSASWRCCRAWAIPSPISRTSARSRSGTRRPSSEQYLQDGWLTRTFVAAADAAAISPPTA